MKTKLRTHRNKVYNNFRGLNIPEDSPECEFFIFISVDSLLDCNNKYYLHVYLGNCAYKIVKTQMKDYFDNNLF